LPQGVRTLVTPLRAKATLAACRDIALITFQRSSGAKPGAISGMNRSDIRFSRRTLQARIRIAGKAPAFIDLLPDPQSDLCPVRAMNEYLARIDPVPEDKPLFRRVTRWDAFIGEKRLHPLSITDIIKRAAQGGGLEAERISAQSIRLGRIAETIAYQGSDHNAIAVVVGYLQTSHLKSFILDASNMQDELLARERL